MPRRSKKPRHALPKGAVPYPLVDSGNPSYRDQARATAHPTRPRHRLVALATRSPGRGTPRSPQGKNATVMLAPCERLHPGGTHPPTPRRPNRRAYKLRQQPVEAPGAWTARGFFLWQSRRFSPATQILCEHVSRATLRVHATCRPSHFSSMRLLGFLSHSFNSWQRTHDSENRWR